MSALRIASIPVLVLLASRGERDLYLVCLAISLSTDLLDGLLARLLNQRTELGAKLDLWGDVGVLLSMPFALWRMWPEVLHSERWLIGAALASYVVSATLAMCKFRRLASYHSWLGKTAVMVLALGGFAAMFGWTLWLLRIGLLLITAAIIEEITISLLLTEARSDLPSWWHARRLAEPNKPSDKRSSAQFRHNHLKNSCNQLSEFVFGKGSGSAESLLPSRLSSLSYQWQEPFTSGPPRASSIDDIRREES